MSPVLPPIERRCRCLGRNIETGLMSQQSHVLLGQWCGNLATEEDALCENCRDNCIPNGMHLCTLNEVRLRDVALDEVDGAQ